MNEDNRFMHVFFPKGTEREYTKALAPPSREAENSYLKKKTQVLAIRQHGEAWNKPFISIFEPTVGSKSSVHSVEPLMDGQKVVGAKVVSKVGKALITDFIISQDKSDASYVNKNLNLKFEGRFGIARVEEIKGEKTVSLYIGDGKKLSLAKVSIQANSQNKEFKSFKIN